MSRPTKPGKPQGVGTVTKRGFLKINLIKALNPQAYCPRMLRSISARFHACIHDTAATEASGGEGKPSESQSRIPLVARVR